MSSKKSPLLDGFYVSLYNEVEALCFIPDEDSGTLPTDGEECGVVYRIDSKGSESRLIYEAGEVEEGVLISLYNPYLTTNKLVDRYLLYRNALVGFEYYKKCVNRDEEIPMATPFFNQTIGTPDEGWVFRDDCSYVHFWRVGGKEETAEGRYERVNDFILLDPEKVTSSVLFVCNRYLVDRDVMVKPSVKNYK